MSTKKLGYPLENFKLFYEEVKRVKPANRIKRLRPAGIVPAK